jgi:uncharacterized protein
MRVILDTHIPCSALLTSGGPTDRLYRAWRDARFVLLTSEQQLEEFRRVARYPRLRRFIEPVTAGAMHNELRRLAVLIEKLPLSTRLQIPPTIFSLRWRRWALDWITCAGCGL